MSFLDPLRAVFAEQGLRLQQIGQQPVPVWAARRGGENNWWLALELLDSENNS